MGRRYVSDWPLSRPMLLVSALYDGSITQAALLEWRKETTREFAQRPLCTGCRGMLRDPTHVKEFGALVGAQLTIELNRPIDKDADDLEDLMRAS